MANPHYEPNPYHIRDEAYRLAAKYGVQRSSEDMGEQRILRLHVDKLNGFISPMTTVDLTNGGVKRYIPGVFMDTVTIPDEWKKGNNEVRSYGADDFKDILADLPSLTGGHLSVPDAWAANSDSAEWDYQNASAISTHAYASDHHPFTGRWDCHYFVLRRNNPFGAPQGVHPWPFMESEMNPFPLATPEKVWHPQKNPDGWLKTVEMDERMIDETYDYVEQLGVAALWTQHCWKMSRSAAMDPVAMANLLYHHFLRGWTAAEPIGFFKGLSHRADEFGLGGPEVIYPDDEHGQKKFNVVQLLTDGFPDQNIPPYYLIVVDGQAGSHCVLTSIEQMVEHAEKSGRSDVIERIVYLFDTCKIIPGFEEATEKRVAVLKEKGVRFESVKTFRLVA
jgi:hypothetical protein